MKTKITFDSPRAVQDWLEETFADGAMLVYGQIQTYVAQPMVDAFKSGRFLLQAMDLGTDKMHFIDAAEAWDLTAEDPDDPTAPAATHKKYLLKTPSTEYTISADVTYPVARAAQALKKDMAHFYRFDTHFPEETS